MSFYDLNDAPEQRPDGVIPDGTYTAIKMALRPGGENVAGKARVGIRKGVGAVGKDRCKGERPAGDAEAREPVGAVRRPEQLVMPAPEILEDIDGHPRIAVEAFKVHYIVQRHRSSSSLTYA